MTAIKVENRGVLYENPIPDLRSRDGYFPGVARLEGDHLIAVFAEGEAFESTDMTTNVSFSRDNGITWSKQGPVYEKDRENKLTTDSLKVTVVDEDTLIALGYRFDRGEPDSPLANPETGGLRRSEIVLCESRDRGKSWNGPRIVAHSFAEGVEASSPLVVLNNGHWVTPITNFVDWDGNCSQGYHGRLLRSEDKGKSWTDRTITMEFPGRGVTIWEQRICQLETGRIVLLAWNEEIDSGNALANHFALSDDNGLTFGKPMTTGIMGQASSLTALGGTRLLSLHCMRKGTDTPGIKACIVDIGQGAWDIRYECMLWEPSASIRESKHAIRQFAFLKFGQPSAIRLSDGSYYMAHWYKEDGHGKILWTKFQIEA